MIIVGTTTPDVLWPTTACLVQTELKLPMVGSFDLYAAETSSAGSPQRRDPLHRGRREGRLADWRRL